MKKWFKFYSDFRTNPKLRRMTPHQKWAYVILLCLACESSNPGKIQRFDDDDLAYCLEMEVEEWVAFRELLIRKQFIELTSSGEIIISDWDKTQGYSETGRLPAKEWREIRTHVFQRDDYTCQYCGIRGVRLQCDHIIPFSRGGSNELENLVTACYKT